MRAELILLMLIGWAAVRANGWATCSDGNNDPCDGCDNGQPLPGFVCPFGEGVLCLRDGHALVDPPVFTEAFVGTDTLQLVTTAATYGRTAFLTQFVALSDTPVDLAWPDWQSIPGTCDSSSVLTVTLANLIGHAGELDLSGPNWYRFKFLIRTTITESVWMYAVEPNETTLPLPELVSRTTVADFRFILTIERTVTVGSSILGLSDNVIYAMIQKSEYIPGNPSFVNFQIETVTADGVTIDTTNLPTADVSGSPTFQGVSGVAFDGYIGSPQHQLWSFSVNLGCKFSTCSFAEGDQIRVNVNVISDDPDNAAFAPEPVVLHFYNLESENWCTATESVELHGNQRTFVDPALTDQSTYFFIDETVYVRDRLWYTENLVSEPSDRATITDVVVITEDQEKVHLLAEAAADLVIDSDCPGFVCYHFVLASSLFNPGETFRIRTHFTVDLPTGKRAEELLEANLESMGYTSAEGNGDQGQGTAKLPTWAIGSIAGVGAVALLALIVGATVLSVKARRSQRSIPPPPPPLRMLGATTAAITQI